MKAWCTYIMKPFSHGKNDVVLWAMLWMELASMGLNKLARERQIPHCMWNLRKKSKTNLSHTASSHRAESRTVVTQGLGQWGGRVGKADQEEQEMVTW